jgi:hypothetical protein
MVTPVPHAGVRPLCKASIASAGRDGALTDADFRGCRWIEGDPSPLRPGMFCGHRVAPGESWCPKHRGVVFGQELAADSQPPGLRGGPAALWQDGRSVRSGPAANGHEH